MTAGMVIPHGGQSIGLIASIQISQEEQQRLWLSYCTNLLLVAVLHHNPVERDEQRGNAILTVAASPPGWEFSRRIFDDVAVGSSVTQSTISHDFVNSDEDLLKLLAKG
jgi:hypothetical protein